jgi:hypothetical protein
VYSEVDHRAVTWLTSLANLNDLVSIRHAPLPRSYFTDMVLALEATATHGDSAFCLLPRARGPEVVSEVADLIIRIEDVDRAACAAQIDGAVYVSVRAADDHNAVALARRMLLGLGHAGGHRHRAGGKIEKSRQTALEREFLAGELQSRWLEACRTGDQAEQPLIDRGAPAAHD